MEVLAVTFKTGEFPVFVNGRQKGTVTVARDGLLLAIECACAHDGPPAPHPGHVPRLVALCGETYVPLGVPVPQDGMLRLKRRFSRSALKALGYTDPESFLLMTKYELEAAQGRSAPPAESAPAESAAEGVMPAAAEGAAEKPEPAPDEPDRAESTSRPAPHAPPETKAAALDKEAPPGEPAPPRRAGDERPAFRRPLFLGFAESQKAGKPELNQDSKSAPSAPEPANTAHKSEEIGLKPDAAAPSPPSAAAPPPPAPPPETAAQKVPDDGAKAAEKALEPAECKAPQEAPDTLNEHSNPLEALAPALETLFSALGAPNPLAPAAEEARHQAQAPAAEAPPASEAKAGEGEKPEGEAPGLKEAAEASAPLIAPGAEVPAEEEPEAVRGVSPEAADRSPPSSRTPSPDLNLPAPKSAAEIAQIRFDEPDLRRPRRPYLEAYPGAAREDKPQSAAPEEEPGEDEAPGEALPLVGGWRPAPPLSRLIEDPELYEGRESIPGALVTEQDGFTLLAVPVSPEEPFPLMGIFCFGYPTQIGDKDYILFKLQDGALAL